MGSTTLILAISLTAFRVLASSIVAFSSFCSSLALLRYISVRRFVKMALISASDLFVNFSLSSSCWRFSFLLRVKKTVLPLRLNGIGPEVNNGYSNSALWNNAKKSQSSEADSAKVGLSVTCLTSYMSLASS